MQNSLLSKHLLVALLCSLPLAGMAEVTPAFVTTRTDSNIYSFLPDGSNLPPILATTMPGGLPADTIAISDTTAFVTTLPSSFIYTFSTANPQTPVLFATLPGSEQALGIAISNNGPTVFVSTGGTGKIYSFLATGSPTPTLVTTMPGGDTAVFLTISRDSSTVFVTNDQTPGNVYSFPVDGSQSPALLASLPLDTAGCIAISADGSTAFLTNDDSTPPTGMIYTFPTTSANAPHTPILFQTYTDSDPGGGSAFIALSTDGSTAFVTNRANNPGTIYSFLTNGTGSASLFTTIPNNEISGAIATYQPQLSFSIPTTNLTGQVLTVANYLNGLSLTALSSVSLLSGDPLIDALESICPARNAFPIFATDMAQFFVNGLLEDHLRQNSFVQQQEFWESNEQAKSDLLQPTELLASACMRSQRPSRTKACETYYLWAEGFGDYGRTKAQEQTPAFTNRGGGLIAGFDYYRERGKAFGIAAAYAYTDVKEGSAGHAKINQEFIAFYGSTRTSKSYVDMALWGGLYQIRNARHISYPGFDATATSSPRGWQLTPHLELGSHLDRSWFRLEPFAMLDWVNNWTKTFQEKNGSFLNMEQKSHWGSLLRSELGLRFYEMIRYNWGCVVFQEKGSYVNRTSFNMGRITAFLVGQPGSFTVETLSATQNLGLVELELRFIPNTKTHPTVSFSYQGEFGSLSEANLLFVSLELDF